MINSRNNTLVFIAVIAGVLLLAWVFIKPNFEKLNELNKAIAWVQEDIRILGEAKMRIGEVTAFVDELDPSDKELVKLAMPSLKDNAAVAYLINKLAEENGTVLTSIQVVENKNTKVATSKLISLSITFKAEGSYASLKSFFTQLESNLRIFDINTIDILKSQTENTLSVMVRGTTYYFPN